MRIMHFGNVPFDYDDLETGGLTLRSSGGWIATLIEQLLNETGIQLTYSAFGTVKRIQKSHGTKVNVYKIPYVWRNSEKGLKACAEIINTNKPDLIHIHGTEMAYGLLFPRRLVKTPVVISMQGLLGPCSEWYRFFGKRSPLDFIKIHRLMELPFMRGQIFNFLQLKKMAKREKEIIQGNKFFMGRTEWDEAYIKYLNAESQYFNEGRMLRKPFWNEQWSIDKTERNRIIFTNAGHPRKGSEILIDAVRMLLPDYPQIKLYLVGNISHRNGYGIYIRKKIKELGEHVIELGPLNASKMVDELLKSHVFVTPTFIDNSSNAVSEAQLVGMPVISTYAGGLPSLIKDRVNGLFFPTGDSFMLAARIREVFESDNLAIDLGSEAHRVAAKRHDHETVLKEIISNYECILAY